MSQFSIALQGPPQASNMEGIAITVNGEKPLTVFTKLSVLDICRGPGYVYGFGDVIIISSAPHAIYYVNSFMTELPLI